MKIEEDDEDDGGVGTWNHRVVRRWGSNGDPYLVLTEVHYTDGKPYGFALDWTVSGYDYEAEGEDPAKHSDERALNELRTTVERLKKALDQPILDEKDDFILREKTKETS
jgi:hypothetical protein